MTSVGFALEDHFRCSRGTRHEEKLEVARRSNSYFEMISGALLFNPYSPTRKSSIDCFRGRVEDLPEGA